jgi:hypothetical protein
MIQVGENELPDNLFPFVDQIVREDLVDEVILTKSSNVVQLFPKLKEYGITRATLPTVLGGESRWESKRLLNMASPKKLQILRTKASREDGERQDVVLPQGYDSPVVVSETMNVLGESSDDTRQGPGIIVTGNLDYADSSTVSVARGGRSKNAIYSRRKYLRKKIEFEVLENECKRLRTTNADLKQEGHRLEQLLQKALQEAQRQATHTFNLSASLNSQIFPSYGKIFAQGLPIYTPSSTTSLQQHMLNDPALLFGSSQSNRHSLTTQSASVTHASLLDPGNVTQLSPIVAAQLQEQARRHIGGVALPLPLALGVNQRDAHLSIQLPQTSPAYPGVHYHILGLAYQDALKTHGQQFTERDVHQFFLQRLHETQKRKRF